MTQPPPADRLRGSFSRLRAAVQARPLVAGGVLVFAAALLLRLALVRLGLPYAAHPDEAQLLHRGIQMLKTGDLNPAYFNYPSFPMYVHMGVAASSFLTLIGEGAVKSLEQIQTMLDTGLKWQRVPEVMILRGRMLSAGLGALGALGTFLVGARLFNARVGTLAGLFVAFAVVHVNATRFIATDAFATATTAFAVYAAVRILQEGRLGDYALAGALVGLSAASKYNAGVILAVPILAHVLRRDHRWGHVGPLALLVGTTGAVFLGTNPYALLDLPTFVEGVAAEIRHYREGESYGPANVQPGLPHLARIAKTLVSTEGMSLWAALAPVGLLLGWRRGLDRWAVALLFPALAAWLLVGQAVFFARNLVLLVPGVSLAAAVAVDELLVRVPGWARERTTAARWTVAALVSVPALVGALWVASDASRAESRVEIVEFARAQLPPGSKVAVPEEMDIAMLGWDADPTATSVPVKVKLADMSPAALAAEGVTHTILSDKLAYAGGFSGLTGRKVELLDEGTALLDAVHVVGAGPYTLGQNIFAPRVGVYALTDPAKVAAADAKFTVPAADPTWGYVTNGGFEDEVQGKEPPGYMVIPPTVASTEVVDDPERGRVLRVVAKKDANPTLVCMRGEVALDGLVALRGFWKAEGLEPGVRAQVRYWPSGPLAQIKEVGAATDTAGAWQAFGGVVEIPKGVKRTKVCIFVQSDEGTVLLDDLYLGPATPGEVAQVAGAAAPAAPAGPPLPGAWSPVPTSLTAEGYAGPVGDAGFFLVGRLTGESLVCDNTPRPVDGPVRLRATATVKGTRPGTPEGQWPRVQVRGMTQAGGTAARIDETLVFRQDGENVAVEGTATMPKEIGYYKLCAVVRTAETRLEIASIEAGRAP